MRKSKPQDVPFNYAEEFVTNIPSPPVSGPSASVPAGSDLPAEEKPHVPDSAPPLTGEDLRALESRVEYLQDFIARKFSADRQKQELYDRLYEHMDGMKEGFHWEIIKPLVNAVIVAIDANDSVAPRTAEIDMLQQGLRDILLPYGVERMEVVPGQAFDAKLHMALRTVEAPETPPGRVVSIEKPGYLRGDRILRPAQVTVSQ